MVKADVNGNGKIGMEENYLYITNSLSSTVYGQCRGNADNFLFYIGNINIK